jgi:hypothetical protein
MGETVVKYTADGKLYTPDGKPVEVVTKKEGKLPRPVVHCLGRVEQILACASRLMDRDSDPG